MCRWEVFKQQVKEMLHNSDQKGMELKKPGGSLYNFPMPDCMCKQTAARNEKGNQIEARNENDKQTEARNEKNKQIEAINEEGISRSK